LESIVKSIEQLVHLHFIQAFDRQPILQKYGQLLISFSQDLIVQFLNELYEKRVNKHFAIDQENIENMRGYMGMVVHEIDYKDCH